MGEKIGQKYFLKPGEWFFSTQGEIVHTILGSCVSITMFYAPSEAGAICHAVMPNSAGPVSRKVCSRYVNCIVEEMVKSFVKIGAVPEELDIKLFGGADMMKGQKKVYEIGRKNIETAKHIIDSMGLDIKKSSVGGSKGRVLFFETGTGNVFVRQITIQ